MDRLITLEVKTTYNILINSNVSFIKIISFQYLILYNKYEYM